MSLTDQFKPFTEEDFANAFQKEVKNGDFRELLTWKTYEGIDVAPFYHSEKKKVSSVLSFGNDWEVNQEIFITDVKSANAEALTVLNHGVSSITFVGSINSVDELEILLNEIRIEFIELNFKNSGNSVIGFLEEICRRRELNNEFIRGCFHFTEDSGITDVSFPNMQLFVVNASVFHYAGANIIQQLGFAISQGKEWIGHLISKGFHPETAIKQIRFSVATGPNYFFEIAKIKCLRILWQNIVEEYIHKSIPVYVHAETSAMWLAKEDVNNNLIRATFQAMSAVLGGADSLYVHPYNGQKSSARISTNVQLVIKEEGFLNRVGDTANGSFYLSEITHELVQKSWQLFLQTEEKGGYAACIKSEWIQNAIYTSAVQLKNDIATCKIKIIGVNKHRSDKTEKVFTSTLPANKDLKAIDLFA